MRYECAELAEFSKDELLGEGSQQLQYRSKAYKHLYVDTPTH